VTTTPLPAETTWSPPTATLFQRLAALRGELDRVVRELNVLCTGCPTDADNQLRDLQEQFRGRGLSPRVDARLPDATW
jgi:hypothetical protein